MKTLFWQYSLAIIIGWLIATGVVFNFLVFLCLCGYRVILTAPEQYLNFLRQLGFVIVYVK